MHCLKGQGEMTKDNFSICSKNIQQTSIPIHDKIISEN